MKNYCEKCRTAFEGERCPVCGRKKVRPAESEDLCLLTEKEEIWSEAVGDALTMNGIPFVMKNVLGAGVTVLTGLMRERVRFYVYFRQLDEARGTVEELFPSEQSGDGMSFEVSEPETIAAGAGEEIEEDTEMEEQIVTVKIRTKGEKCVMTDSEIRQWYGEKIAGLFNPEYGTPEITVSVERREIK